MKMQQIFPAIFLFATLLTGCDFIKSKIPDKKGDVFYKDRGGFDRPRIPLIKPYELLKGEKTEWSMELLTTDLLTLAVDHVKGVNVTQERILLYSEGGTEVRNKQYQQAWFIIDPSLKREVAFFDHKRYADSLRSLKITDTILGVPDDIYQDFYKSKKLKWSPQDMK